MQKILFGSCIVVLLGGCHQSVNLQKQLSTWTTTSENVSKMELLVDAEGEESWPAPLGKDLVIYDSYVEDNSDIFAVSLSGGVAKHQLTTASGADRCPSPHPNGRNFTYLSDRSGSVAYYMGEMGKPISVLLTEVSAPFIGAYAPGAVSPDGSQFLYTSGKYIWVLNLHTGVKVQLIEGYRPKWTPDGAHIIFLKVARNLRDNRVSFSLWKMRADATELVEIIPGTEKHSIGSASVSPDGGRICYERATIQAGTGMLDPSDLWVCLADGTGSFQVTTHPLNDSEPSWLDNNRIVFTSKRPKSGKAADVRWDIWILSLH